ncbi:MAG: nitrilase-related carbon-nitrogen hydrolase [Asticcacaulis sp.]
MLIGSAIFRSGKDERVVNRTLLVDAEGEIAARYDKIHLFDADTPDGKSYRESAGVIAGRARRRRRYRMGRAGIEHLL